MNDQTSTPPVPVVVVHAEACHLCDDAVEALTELSRTLPLEVRVVELESAEGASLVAVHRPAMNPLVLVDGAYFSAGRLPRKKLVKVLERRSSQHNSSVGA
ncbi:glutaredoxin [Cellulomonas sp. Root137]|uniref:glutaredoxin n=1 Tax=Cellulomonas sp. Root137 TaxID=1736459 RepID=UPI0006F41732|nr:glutaredoxin [Cellulomonas sp. Root137]KQY47958.1 glutaredoxin [Cellulomonas sp. Root137]